jgi:hypothetical protein
MHVCAQEEKPGDDSAGRQAMRTDILGTHTVLIRKSIDRQGHASTSIAVQHPKTSLFFLRTHGYS